MQYNIHPILVHFPIALLFIYSLVKILPLAKWMPRVAWKDIERVLLFLGFLGACAALLTGDTAEHIARPPHDIVEMHATFATLSVWLYSALLVGELAAWIRMKWTELLEKQKGISVVLKFLEKVFGNDGFFPKLIALAALFSITITGMLGGIMVYGTGADPLAPTVMKLLGLSL